MSDIMDYMPIFIFVPAAIFLILFFVSIAKTTKKDQQFSDNHIFLADVAKSFEVLDGEDVVAFPCSQYTEPNKTAAIINAMSSREVISDEGGNQYISKEYLKKYSHHKHLFRGSVYYLVFSISSTGNKTADVEANLFPEIQR